MPKNRPYGKEVHLKAALFALRICAVRIKERGEKGV